MDEDLLKELDSENIPEPQILSRLLTQKFLLELLVKANYKKVKEIPITFKNRTAGKSKFNFSDVKNFISSIIELRKFKKIKWKVALFPEN